MEVTGARRHPLIWLAVIPILIWGIVRAFDLDSGPPAVPLIAYTPYVAALALLVAGVATALENWAAALLAGCAALVLVAAVLPRAVGEGEPIPDRDGELRILSANIHLGHADAGALIAMVRRLRPDVLCLQELTPHFTAELERGGLPELLPHAALSIAPGASGGGIFSSLPLKWLGGPPTVAFRMPRAAATLPDGRRVQIVDVHPYPPKRGSVDLWSRGLDSLPQTGPGGDPWVLAGDFNATLDFSKLRGIVDGGYRDAAEVTGDGLEPTWPRDGTLPPPVTIDHVLADERVAIAGYSVETLPGSDHHPIFARLGIP